MKVLALLLLGVFAAQSTPACAAGAGCLHAIGSRLVRRAQYMAPRQYMQRLNPPAPTPAPTVSPTPPPQQPAAAANATREAAKKKESQKKVVEFLSAKAKAGAAYAQFDLGKRYILGDGVETNFVEARKWLEAAAKQNHAGASNTLAELTRLEARLKKPAPKSPEK